MKGLVFHVSHPFYSTDTTTRRTTVSSRDSYFNNGLNRFVMSNDKSVFMIQFFIHIFATPSFEIVHLDFEYFVNNIHIVYY